MGKLNRKINSKIGKEKKLQLSQKGKLLHNYCEIMIRNELTYISDGWTESNLYRLRQVELVIKVEIKVLIVHI